MSEPTRNLALESIRKRSRPTVSRELDNLSILEEPVTPVVSTEVSKPVKQVRRTLRVDADVNKLIKLMIAQGEGEVSIDVLVEAAFLVVADSESLQEQVIAVAQSRASARRERSLRVRKQNRAQKHRGH